MKALITAIIIALFTTFANAQFTSTGDSEIRTEIVYFNCNSSVVVNEINIPANATILSVDAYASIDGSTSSNQSLSEARGHAVSSIIDFKYTAHGETTKFGNKASNNRCVVITYSVPKTEPTSTSTKTDVEGFTCNNKIDPSVYFEDTLNVDTASVIVPEPIVLETIEPVLEIETIVTKIAPIAVDTFFLPTRQAVRFQMKEHGMSRAEAIKSIEARKSQWKQLDKKKSKKKVKLPRKTMGKNDSFWSHIRPFRGC